MDALENQLEACRECALRLLEQRAHSVTEMHRKLCTRKFPQNAIQQVIQTLGSVGLLDDEAFARNYCEYRMNGGRPPGRRKVEAELWKRGIDRPIVDKVLGEIWDAEGEDAELDRAVQAGRIKWESVRRRMTDARKARDSVFRFLAGRGFSTDICRRVLDNLDDESE